MPRSRSPGAWPAAGDADDATPPTGFVPGHLTTAILRPPAAARDQHASAAAQVAIFSRATSAPSSSWPELCGCDRVESRGERARGGHGDLP